MDGSREQGQGLACAQRLTNPSQISLVSVALDPTAYLGLSPLRNRAYFLPRVGIQYLVRGEGRYLWL